MAKKLGIKAGATVALLGAPDGFAEDTVREVFLPLGLVDNKVCAIDDTWSGLRVVWRTELRTELRTAAGS